MQELPWYLKIEPQYAFRLVDVRWINSCDKSFQHLIPILHQLHTLDIFNISDYNSLKNCTFLEKLILGKCPRDMTNLKIILSLPKLMYLETISFI